MGDRCGGDRQGELQSAPTISKLGNDTYCLFPSKDGRAIYSSWHSVQSIIEHARTITALVGILECFFAGLLCIEIVI